MELTYTLDELPQVASRILKATEHRTLLFFADMGVGKTTLIKELASQLGVTESLSSPTFSIVNEHSTSDSSLYHFDFYRIEKEEEALDIGIEDYLDSGAWVFIEWPKKIQGLWPSDYAKIEIVKNNDQSRTLKLTPVK
jgi:tRNA threonylcarbamoyladenosine biosynthesis protein TsaE